MNDTVSIGIVKQLNSKLNIPNPDGRGGFSDHPQNINRNGRKPNQFSCARLLEDVSRDMGYLSELDLKYLVARKLFMLAINGNIQAAREIFNRMDGKPRRSTV